MQVHGPLAIAKRGKVCAGTGEPFRPGSDVYSILVLNSEGEFERKDYSASYWQEQGEASLLAGTCGHWKSHIPVPEASPQTVHQQAINHLKRLVDEAQEQELAQLFAQYLQRSKQLSLCLGARKGPDKGSLYFEVPNTGEMIAVQKVPIQKEHLPEVEAKLFELVREIYPEVNDA